MELISEFESKVQLICEPYREALIVVACSGGVDSITLLYLLKKMKFNVEAIHVNYNLRGEESIQDAAFVKLFCDKFEIPLEIKSVDTQEYLDANGGNLQEEARSIRYRFFEEVIAKSKCKVFLGHHLDDQVELLFMNIFRKAGMKGMGAMRQENRSYIRPLLEFEKTELIQYANSIKLPWRNDSSNLSVKYMRNKWRNVLLPELLIEFPNLKKSVGKMTAVFQRNQIELEESVKKELENYFQTSFLDYSIYDNWNEFEKVCFLNLIEVKSHLVNELDKLRKANNGAFLQLKGTTVEQDIEVRKERSGFYFGTIECTVKKKLLVTEIDQMPRCFSKKEIYLDKDLIEGELVLRKWELGDRIRPLGVKGSKLVSDIIKDAKLSIIEKERVLVVTDDIEIIWVVGLTVGANKIAMNNSLQVVKVEIV